MDNAPPPEQPGKQSSMSNLAENESGDFDPFFFDWLSLSTPEAVSEPAQERRQSTRHQNKEVNYADSDVESEANDDNTVETVQEETYIREHRIEHIFMSRESSTGLEYLVTFQNSDSPFAQWLPVAILTEISNYPRQLRKFNEMDAPSFSSIFTTPTQITFKSPLHILSHRLLSSDHTSKKFEYLFQLSLETGNVFFWEEPNPNTPSNLIDHYWRARKCVKNTHPRALFTPIAKEMASSFSSVDGQFPRDYQIDGVNWMIRSLTRGHGCILADEMGLGKTIQSLVFLEHLDRTTDWHGPHLIAVRINTFDQWCSELERWSDLKFIAYTGQPETRHIIEQYQMPYRDDDGNVVNDCVSFNILLVTYDIVLKDLDVMKGIDWQIMIVDEGHRIKNNSGKKHNAFSAIHVMQRIILTGTPIQNSLAELWTLLNFVSPLHFQDHMIFPEDDVESLDDDVLARLRDTIAPHLMHRSLLDVEKSVVPKDERIAFLKLTQPQKDLLRLTKMHELWRIKKGGTDETQSETNMMQRICNHPFLIEGAEEYYAEKMQLPKLELLVNCSAKLIFLDRILPIFKRAGSSVLIFSQRVKILKLLAEYCKLKKYTYEMLIGQLTDAEKKNAISKFCDTENDVFIFLISTRSGAEGLNLTRANIAIIFDPDWNPQNDLQAQGRCHRIGQTQKVDVLRLVTYGTYEHEMFARAQRKLNLWTSILGDGKSQDIVASHPIERTAMMMHDSLLCSKPLTDPCHFVLLDAKRDVPVLRSSEPVVSVLTEPPNLATLLPFGDDETYETILSKMATVVTNRDLDRHAAIPTLDLSDGLSDVEFIEKFPSDPSMLGAITKPKTRTASNRIQLDPKIAKTIIGQLVVHGYGRWAEIHRGINEVCPIDQMTKFCQTATVLHLRACDPARVCCFPLLMAKLTDDISGFDYSQAMCSGSKNWYTPFSKRGVQTSEGSVCKMLAGRIRKTCVSFLTQLENHILIDQWKSKVGADKFPFELLPPLFGYDRARDVALYQSMIDKVQLNECDVTRAGQICTVIKSEIMRRKTPIRRILFPFWSIYEVNGLLNVLRSFGTPGTMTPHEFAAKTSLLSKDEDKIATFAHMLYCCMSSHKPGNTAPLLLQNSYTMIQTAPHGTLSPISLDCQLVTDVVKRILLVLVIRSVVSKEEKLAADRDMVCEGGCGWFTCGHCLKLCRMLLKYGCCSMAQILLSDEFGVRDQLLPSDIEFLRGKSYRDLGSVSKIPRFLTTNTGFLAFLRKLDGRADSLSGGESLEFGQQKMTPKAPIPPPKKPEVEGVPGVTAPPAMNDPMMASMQYQQMPRFDPRMGRGMVGYQPGPCDMQGMMMSGFPPFQTIQQFPCGYCYPQYQPRMDGSMGYQMQYPMGPMFQGYLQGKGQKRRGPSARKV